MKTYTFFAANKDGAPGAPLGSFEMTDAGDIDRADPEVAPIIGGWQHSFPDTWQGLYLKDGWSNGYVILKEVVPA